MICKQHANAFFVVIRKHVVISGKTTKKSRFINEGINLHLHVYINKRAYCYAFAATIGLAHHGILPECRCDQQNDVIIYANL